MFVLNLRTIAFKIPSREIDKSEAQFWTHWNPVAKQFFLQLAFKIEAPAIVVSASAEVPVMI